MNRGPIVIVLAVVVGVAGMPRAAPAEMTVAEGDDDDGRLLLAGYARLIGGYHDLGYGEPLVTEKRGLNMGVGRLEWTLEFSPDVVAKIHQDLTWNLRTGATAAGESPLFGVGTSRVGERTVDLQTTLVDEDGVRLTHDVDRLAFDVYTEAVDLTIGRQGITWGNSVVFPVADLWSRFGPFDLDTEQKPGVDAVRALVYPNMTSQLDIVVVDRGTLEDLSGGVRYGSTVGSAELYGAAGKFWDEILALGGMSWVAGRAKFRVEAVAPFAYEEGDFGLPRATVGGEWYGADFSLGAEYHFNGVGADEPDDYAEQIQSEQYARGESYFLGRHYAGIYGSYGGIPDVEMNLSTIANLGDPSLMVTPTFRYAVAQNASIAVGALVSAGETPSLTPPAPTFESEFGTYGDFAFVELAAYY